VNEDGEFGWLLTLYTFRRERGGNSTSSLTTNLLGQHSKVYTAANIYRIMYIYIDISGLCIVYPKCNGGFYT
jgi:hypothetical protein